MSFSRTQELEADKAGLEMYQKLGYDPQEALKTMDILEKINIDKNEKEVNLYSFLKIDSLNKRKMEKDSLFLINSTKIDTNKMAVEAIMDTLKAISMDTISKSTPVQITLNGNEKTPNDSTTTKTTKKKRSYYNWINTITTKTDTSKIDVTVTERKEEQEDLSTHPDTKERKDSLERFLLLDSIKHQNKQSVSLQVTFNYFRNKEDQRIRFAIDKLKLLLIIKWLKDKNFHRIKSRVRFKNDLARIWLKELIQLRLSSKRKFIYAEEMKLVISLSSKD